MQKFTDNFARITLKVKAIYNSLKMFLELYLYTVGNKINVKIHEGHIVSSSIFYNL